MSGALVLVQRDERLQDWGGEGQEVRGQNHPKVQAERIAETKAGRRCCTLSVSGPSVDDDGGAGEPSV